MSGGGERRDRREEVLAAAVEIFHEKGYPSASIQSVADRVGLLKSSLYHYIDSKEDLLARVFEESDAASFGLMAEIRDLDLSAAGRLREFARRWSLWYMRNIERASIYINEWRHLSGERRAEALRTRREYEQRVRAIIEDVKADGEAPAELDSRHATFFVLSALNGLPTWYRRDGPDSAERIADAYAEMIVGAVCGNP